MGSITQATLVIINVFLCEVICHFLQKNLNWNFFNKVNSTNFSKFSIFFPIFLYHKIEGKNPNYNDVCPQNLS
jgi:hypothetical protein